MSTGNEKQKILIVDDSEMNRSILADMLGDEYEIVEAVDGAEAVARLNMDSTDISLLLLDIVMPNMDGFEVLAVMNRRNWIQDIPVIMISAENTSSYIEHAYELGVTDFISRPFDGQIVHRRVINTIMLYAKQKRLIELVSDQIYEKERSNNLMVSILSHIVEFRNGESGMHVLHINMMTEILLQTVMRKTDKYNLKRSDIPIITMASALHDIGKISIPGEILNKPGKLTKEEFDTMKTHTLVGAEMLDQLTYYKDEALVKVAYQICRWHHERYDGRGYPDGLAGEEIPIAAQIVALADVYDALTSVRVYKPAFSHEKAIEMITNGECGAFNPLLLQCLLESTDSIREQLAVNSIKQESDRNIRNITEDLLHYEDLSASERTLRLLEHERTKYQFFASLSSEVQFEYTEEPSMLTLSDVGAKLLNAAEITMNPFEDEKITSIADEKILEEIRNLVMASTPESPVIQYDGELLINEELRWSRVICRSMWAYEEQPYMTGCIGKIVDIHEEYEKIKNLQRMASYDGLTGLLNQSTSKRLVKERLHEGEGKDFILAIFDIDYFKNANDRCGHMFGDKVLQHMADKLRGSTRDYDITARVGGDEFMIFMEDMSGIDSIIDRIFHALSGKYEGFDISISMGISCSKRVGRDYESLFCCADKALYTAKQAGRAQYCFYDDSMKEILSAISSIDGEE
ncbi:MAG: diguanylate cyclase [Dorea sp.]|nr:diguanylate cyclase [Dorea sp.]